MINTTCDLRKPNNTTRKRTIGLGKKYQLLSVLMRTLVQAAMVGWLERAFCIGSCDDPVPKVLGDLSTGPWHDDLVLMVRTGSCHDPVLISPKVLSIPGAND